MSSRASTNRTPFLPEKTIEGEAELLLGEYARDREPITSPPVPVEEVLELQLGLTVELDDLRAMFGCEDVLGAIWFKDGLVRIDRSLDPHENPSMLGRFRFTLAHEAAHWRLHKALYREDPDQAHLYGGRGTPAFVCRSSEKPPVEWQADRFASFLLTPRAMVIAAWQDWRGGLDPVCLDEHDRGKAPELVASMLESICRPLAAQFEVSRPAMRIRLESLGLLLREPSPTLF